MIYLGGWKALNRSLTKDVIREELIRLGKISFRNAYWFKHSKGIKMKIHNLKKKLRKEGLSREEIKKHVEDLINREDERLYNEVIKIITDEIYNLVREGSSQKHLNRIRYYEKWYLEKYLDFLIQQGMIKAIYRGPSPKGFSDEECRKVRSIPRDPWNKDPYKSGALKIWLLYTTGNKTLRKNRLKCWAPYIVIDFSPLITILTKNK